MKTLLFSVRDDLDSFGRVFSCPSDAYAKRDFASAVNSGDSAIRFSPADFSLYRLGEFDSSTGLIKPETVPFFICRGSDVKDE